MKGLVVDTPERLSGEMQPKGCVCVNLLQSIILLLLSVLILVEFWAMGRGGDVGVVL